MGDVEIMTLFDRTVLPAYSHAESGGQALFIPTRQPKRGKVGWLIDHRIERLMATAHRLGVRAVVVDRAHLHGQYILLRGVPLERAMNEAKSPELAL